MENVRIHSKRFNNTDQVGLQIEEGFRVRLQRVQFTNWRTGGTALRLEGVQYGHFEDCMIEDSDTSMVITGYANGPPSTALTFTHCQFRGHLGKSQGSSVIIRPYIKDAEQSSGARTCVFEHCYFENARDGAGRFIEANSTRFLTLLNCHFEKAGDGFPHIELSTELSDDGDGIALSNRILYCIFSNTKPLVDDIPHIRIGRNVDRTLLIGNQHAVTTPAVEDKGTNTTIIIQ